MGKRYVRAEGFPNIKRQTERKYSHVVIGTYNAAAARAESAVASATKYAQSSYRNWAKGDDQYSRRVLEQLSAQGIHSEEAYVHFELANREARIAKEEALGFRALAWCGRRDLAVKQLPTFLRHNSWTNLQIVPVVE